VTRAVAWGLWVAIVASFLGAVVLSGTAAEDGEGFAAAYTLFVVAFATMGALVASRQPANPIGWILIGASLAYALGGLVIDAVENGKAPPLVAWVSTWVWMAGVGPVATFGLLLFPDGRLPSPRWRWVAWLAAVANALTVIGIAVVPGRIEDTNVENPFGLEAVPDVLGAVAGVALLVAVAASIASLFVRFRRARSVERQQLKWLTYASALVGVMLAASLVIEQVGGGSAADLSNLIVTIALAFVPVAMAIAILRHRLYDIDVVINRTLVYGALTATLGAAYLTLALLLGLTVGRSDVSVAVSTLAVAALFGPARRRIQAAVDRRFYRRRYDAARTLEAFSGRLRDEIDLDALRAEVAAVVGETVQPAHVSVWLRESR
jgi:hypothetical protein